ncbi:MAG: hypothetical protein LBP54_02515 [Campylobacteraceae bacterium]|jgi:hypothetical protein|nr:hypothetical protein [Campylobacteraceae bacterium]
MSEIIVDELLEQMAADNWNAADDILSKGYPVIFVEHDTPKGCVLKKYPDGKLELIKVDIAHEKHTVKLLKR